MLDLYPGKIRTCRAKSGGHHDHHTSKAGKAAAKKLDARQLAALLGGERKVIVAVDPGHGGKDPGSHGHLGTLEKNVTLAVGRYLAALINHQKGMKAILTRNGDYFIPLRERYAIARKHKADLFVSIHADSYPGSDARGASVWVLSAHGKTSMAARLLADRENSGDLIGGVSLASENDHLASVLLDMQQRWAVRSSTVVGTDVLKALARLGPTHRPQVEHANFVVLHSPDVPSILVETAFISNRMEERKLRKNSYREALAKAVMSGIRHYFATSPPPGTWFAAQLAKHRRKAASKALLRHRVMYGESLSSIAHRFGVRIHALKKINGMMSDKLRAGVVLMIPVH